MKSNQVTTLIPRPRRSCHLSIRIVPALLAAAVAVLPLRAADQPEDSTPAGNPTLHKTAKVGELNIFYREAGPANAPALVLLHGFPTSSRMFRNLIPALSDRYHVIAPDYPGYGQSSAPSLTEFQYTFDHLADVVDTLIQQIGLQRYSLYVMDYGAPVGFRIAVRHPERVQSLIVQNGNAYEEGLRDFWKPFRAYWADRSITNAEALRKLLVLDATRWQYTNGVRRVEAIDPDNWLVDQTLMDRPGNKDIQLALFYSYGSNPPLYPAWQEYFRHYQPPTLIVWGKNDFIFPAEGAYPYRRDLKNVDFHLIDTGHFALEEDGAVIAALIRDFLAKQNLPTTAVARNNPATMSMAGMTINLETLKGKEFEIAFLTEMIGHHASAVEMANLIPSHTQRPELNKLSVNIIADQKKQISEMRNWLKTWYAQPADETAMTMPGAERLVTARDAEFDRDFIVLMAAHHQGALDMAKLVAARADHPELLTVA